MKSMRPITEGINLVAAAISIIQFALAIIAALYGITIIRDVSIPISDLPINLRPISIISFFFVTFCLAATISLVIIRASLKAEAASVITVAMSLLSYSWISLITIQWMVTGNLNSYQAEIGSQYFMYTVVSCAIAVLFIWLRARPHETIRYERGIEYMHVFPMKIPLGEKTVPIREFNLGINPFLAMGGQVLAYIFLYYPSLLDVR